MELFTPWHVIIVLVVAAFLYFGGKSVPEMSRSLGKSLRVFRSEMRGEDDQSAESTSGAQATGSVAPAALEAPTARGRPLQALPSATPASASPAAPARPRPRPKPAATPTSDRPDTAAS